MMTTTERNYSVLEKKLEEFEALLKDLHSNTTLDHEEIQARLAFLKIVISSEMELNAGVMSERLQNMADRLKLLEDAYENCIGASNLSDDHHRDNKSSCSCTSSCLNEEDEEDLIDSDVISAVNSKRDEEDDGEKNQKENEDNKVQASIKESFPATTNMDAHSSHQREKENRGRKSDNLAETMAATRSKSTFPKDVQMISQAVPVKDPSEQNWMNKCGFVARTVVAAAAVVVVAAAKLWSAEEEVYFVPT